MASSPPSTDPDEQSSAGARCATPFGRSVLRYGWASTPVRSRSEDDDVAGVAVHIAARVAATRWRGGGTRVLHGQGPRRRVWHRVRRSRRARTQGRARDVETVLSRELRRTVSVPTPYLPISAQGTLPNARVRKRPLTCPISPDEAAFATVAVRHFGVAPGQSKPSNVLLLRVCR